MKKNLRFLAAVLSAGTIATGSIFMTQTYDTNAVTTTAVVNSSTDFDKSECIVINGLQFHKTSDTTVEVSKGMDFDTLNIEIPSSITVDNVSYSVTAIAAEAFKNTLQDDDRVYAAKKIVIPDSIIRIGSQCFYDLVNLKSLDLSSIPEYDANDILIAKDILNMNSSAELDRVKVGQLYYKGCWEETLFWSFTNKDFKPVVFCDENKNEMSKWYIKSNVNINELQDPPAKSGGYTFIEWKSKIIHPDAWGSENVEYTEYTPSYEIGEPLLEAEDKIKSALNNTAVNEETKQSEILELAQSCISYDNILCSVDDFKIIPAQNEERGVLKCIISLTDKNDNSKHAFEVNKYLTDLPDEVKIKSITDSYVYKESTKEEEIEDYLEIGLDDIGLGVKIDNFTNDKKQVKGTIIITNKINGEIREFKLNKVVHDNIKLLIKDAIKNLKINSDTEEESVKEQINKYIDDDRYKISIINYKNSNGKITGTIMVQYDNKSVALVKLNESVRGC